jgi:hypothetical protein
MPSARGSHRAPRARGSLRGAREATRPFRGERPGARWLWLAPRRCGRGVACRVCARSRGRPRAERRGGRDVGARLGGRGARISPRSCREHSRSRRRERRATCARRPCSAVSCDCVRCIRRRHSRSCLSACRPLAVHIVRRELAGLFEEHAKQHARFEGRGSMRDGCRSRRDRAVAVSRVASALDREVGLEQSAVATGTSAHDWRSRCSHLPSILPGAFAFTSSRTARDVCSATVLGGLSRLRALHQAHAGALIARRGARADASLAAHAPHVRPRVRVSRRLSRDRW